MAMILNSIQLCRYRSTTVGTLTPHEPSTRTSSTAANIENDTIYHAANNHDYTTTEKELCGRFPDR
jgi:hypothetical protein